MTLGERSWNKVFECGSPKTGTTSLGQAFEMLGLKHRGWDDTLHDEYERGNIAPIIEAARHAEAFEDAPWHNGELYKAFDEAFPGSKFILLERDTDSWLRSYERHFSSVSPERRTSKTVANFSQRKDEFLDKHLQKYEAVKEYFAERPQDLLVMNICAGEGWEKLCPFLATEIVEAPFPIANVTQQAASPSILTRVAGRIRRTLGRNTPTRGRSQ